jgi:hypothetical protein
MTTTKLQALATEVLTYFETATRTSNGAEYHRTKDGAPQWVKDMCWAAHESGGMMPDDWRYGFIVEALGALEDNEDPDEIAMEADIYTSELTDWLGSRADRYAFCDEAMEEFGMEWKDLENGTWTLLALGQRREKDEVLAAVRGFLEEKLTVDAIEDEPDEVETDEVEDEVEDEDDGPDEDALTTSDHVHFYQYGKLVLTVGEDEDMVEAINAWMERKRFFPDVYWISDHGNAHRISLH